MLADTLRHAMLLIWRVPAHDMAIAAAAASLRHAMLLCGV